MHLMNHRLVLTAGISMALAFGTARSAELLSDQGIDLQWSGQCADLVAVNLSRASRLTLAEMALPQIQQLMERAGQAVRQQCPDARQMRFELLRGTYSVVALAGAPAPAPVLRADMPPPPVAAAGRSSGTGLLQPRSALPALSSAANRTAACGVLAQWLESTALPAGHGRGRSIPAAGAVDAFRDEHLLAVFGKVYDEDGGRWREAVFQASIGPCIQPGMAAQPRNALGLLTGLFQGAPPDPNSPEVRRTQEFAHVLRSAFGNQPGALTPAAIGAHLQQVRLHYQQAHAMVERAGQAVSDVAGFRALDPAGPELRALRLLAPADRQRLTEHLQQRRAALALPTAEAWLKTAEALPPTLAGARQTLQGQRELAEVAAVLPPEARQSLQARVESLLESQLAAELQADLAGLEPIPASEDGARRLGDWTAAFQPRYADFARLPSVQRAGQSLTAARTRVLAPLLPAWRTRLAAMPASSSEVAARRAELAAWFGPEPAAQGALHAEFKQALDAREVAVRQQLDAQEQARLQQAQQAQRAQSGAGSSASLQAGDFQRPTGAGGDALAALYEGRFGRVGFEPASLNLRSLVTGYIRGYSQRCRAHIADPVEQTRSECSNYSVTTQGIGIYKQEISRTCTGWVEVPTGIFAERSLDAATRARAVENNMGSLRELMDMASGKGRNPLGTMVASAKQWQALVADGEQVSALNACDSPALQRLRINIEHFLHGRPAVALDGGAPIGVALLPAAPGEAYRDSDYVRLLNDLVTANAASWGFNRYQSGSISGLRVLQRDGGGRPVNVQASYRFQGMSGAQHGRVTLEFREGRPSCLYFADDAHNCRSPSARVVEAFIAGQYR